MTFCIAMKVQDGLVGFADTRVTSGVECSTAKKVTVHEQDGHSMFLMTSGLRSARDKALTYFSEAMEERNQPFDKLYKAVNAFAEQVRRVHAEDKEALKESGFTFNLNCIIGGQLANDKEHKLYQLYPQANWVEVSQGTPYYIIGESSYGKSLLDRLLTYRSSMETAVKIGYLAFEATRRAASDVFFPLDFVLYKRGSDRMFQHRFEIDELSHVGEWWQNGLIDLLKDLPDEWVQSVMAAPSTKPRIVDAI